MSLMKVEAPGLPPPKAGNNGKPRIDWTVLRQMQVGDAVDLPDFANLNVVSVQLSKEHKKRPARYTRRNRRIWRVE